MATDTPIAASSIRAIVVGASGGIGRALADVLASSGHEVHRLSRSVSQSGAVPAGQVDVTVEASVAAAARLLVPSAPYPIIIVASGLLHNGEVTPEKTIRDVDSDGLLKYYAVNSVGPTLVAKHFIPLLPRTGRCVFAVLSAKVGSISDNRLGGWYGYRASKAALNMLVKTLAIEVGRTRPEAICVTLHPGTVDTALSAPFQKAVPPAKLFSAGYAAEKLLTVIDRLNVADSGDCFGWDGERILP